jgi:hypothetical protein
MDALVVLTTPGIVGTVGTSGLFKARDTAAAAICEGLRSNAEYSKRVLSR